ncbi:a glutathione-dependent thiol reductase [Klebsiella pneumoniae]|uniref:A glutathione-dependent thiol reductase n=1 Tax=Klebsiella pneumoniae TaxID=573 RepID=A0A2X3H5T0_KLEPN|nr:a glutathione-dependent thiol reductase [Klebsiella pneumoniae]
MLTMYGIKNCDTIKKARRWLEAHQIEYRFHDYRADGLERAQLDTFIAELGWQALLNTVAPPGANLTSRCAIASIMPTPQPH